MRRLQLRHGGSASRAFLARLGQQLFPSSKVGRRYEGYAKFVRHAVGAVNATAEVDALVASNVREAGAEGRRRAALLRRLQEMASRGSDGAATQLARILVDERFANGRQARVLADLVRDADVTSEALADGEVTAAV